MERSQQADTGRKQAIKAQGRGKKTRQDAKEMSSGACTQQL